jgi:SAM-dependent methyltransferase
MNEDQIKFWNEKAGRDWVELQARMDTNLSNIHAAVLAAAAPQSGESVLDIGCGTGTTSLALADAVGPTGRVLGVDISEPMLTLAKSRGMDRDNLAFELADASVQAFTPDYDLLFSRFGVMFFDDPIGAFANLRRALKPTGRLAFVCWRTPQENPWASAPLTAARPLLPPQEAPDPNAPGPFAFADPQRITSILTDVGLHDVQIDRFDAPMPMGTDVNVIAAQTLQIGPLSRAAGEVDEPARARIVEAVRGALEVYRTPDGEIAPPVGCWLVHARREG